MSNMLRLVVSFATVDRLSGSLKGIVGLAQSGSQRLAGMKREARDLDRELRGVQAELGRSSGNVSALLDREAALKTQIARTNSEMEKQVRLLKIQSQVDAVKARGESLKAAGQQNMFAGAAILAPLLIAGKGAADFQSGMTDIALKADLSRKATAGLQANIIAAARAAKQLPENMRAGVDVLAGFGMSPQEATRMIAPIGKVATAYRAEIADLAQASFANFQNLKVPIAQNARALEIMAAAGNAGAFEIRDMAQYFPTLTAQAQALGQSGVAAVADLAAAAQIARQGTGDSASAATNLQNLLAKINTKETIQKFKKMGTDLPTALKQAYAKGKTPLEAIAEITKKTLGGDLSRISFLFGDMQAQQALRPLIQNMEEYRRIRAEALGSKGAIDAAFARRSEDAAVQARTLVGNLQRLAITLGPVLLPPFVRITEAAVKLSDRFVAWSAANPRLSGTLVGLVAGFGALRIGLGALQFLLGSALGPFASLFGLIMRSGPAVATAFGLMRTAALFLGRGVVTAGAMMLANPLVALIVGIGIAVGTAAYLVYRNWDTIKAAFGAGIAWVQGKWAGFKAWMSSGVQWFIGLHVEFARAGAMMMQGLWNGISARVEAIRSLITGIAGKVVGWFKNVLGIHSPSRVFMGMGHHIAGGLALGIAQAQGAPAAAAQTMADRVIAAPRLEPLTRAAAPAAASTGAARSFGPIAITINAAPGQSAQDIAAEVERILRGLDEHAGARRRSAFADED
ncbi:MAG: phage tail tape measure protein [Sphingobium sp. 66-54]|nr:MAG: phage tail tape measure protein [Sphingobium sp. 66-54]